MFIPLQSMSSNNISLDFLPGGTDGGWEIADSRGELVLLYRGVKFPASTFTEKKDAESGGHHKPGFVVCEPLKQQYKEVPYHQPEDLQGHEYLGLFLLHGDKTNNRRVRGGGGGDGDDGNSISLSNFRVMAALHRPHIWCSNRGVPVACVFSMPTPTPTRSEVKKKGVWSLFSMPTRMSEVKKQGPWPPSSSLFSVGNDWHIVKKAWGDDEEIDVPNTAESFYFAGRAHGSVYWGIEEGTGGGAAAALVLDEATAGFSTFTLPEITLGSYGRCSFRVIGHDDDDDDEMRIVRLIGNELRVYGRIDDKWAVERLVRLPEEVTTRGLPGCDLEGDYFHGDEAVIVDAHDTYLLFRTPHGESTWLFSGVLQTSKEVDDQGRGHESNKQYDDALEPPIGRLRWPIHRLFCCIES